MAAILSDSDFTRFRNLIYDESGIHFSETNRSILESRLRERLRITSRDNVGDYYDHLRRDGEELKEFLDSVTTNLTRFFRNTAHFETFEKFVIPDLIERKKTTTDKQISIWSAGCSTGEEPYTIAMVLMEILPPGYTIKVIASDISLKSLMTAKAGFYPTHRVTGVPEKYLKKYFLEKDAGYQIHPEVMKRVTFDYHNLKHSNGVRGLDIIFCRNVLIYFDDVAQKITVDHFWNAMSAYSYLFIGHSESLFGMKTQFEFVRTDWACVYRKASGRSTIAP
ncbi:MAG: CheR family methyltransferase [Spirochaetota bacterium]